MAASLPGRRLQIASRIDHDAMPIGLPCGLTDSLVSVIAVHGLNPGNKSDAEHAFDTWRAPDGRLWLQDDLPRFVPGARVFIHEYNATVLYGKDRDAFIGKASGLLEEIRAERDEEAKHAIIFLCHSMGGLLVEQALVNAHNNPIYKSTKDYTSGLIFFATPQRGGNPTLVSFGKMIELVAQKVRAQRGPGVMDVLAHGSMYSDILHEHFRHQLLAYDIISFWGSEDNAIARIKVKLIADHGDVCKFGASQRCRDNLKLVGRNVSDVYKKALKKPRKHMFRCPDFERLQTLISVGLEGYQKRRYGKVRIPQHHIPFPRNSNFIGRSNDLERMKRKLFGDNEGDDKSNAGEIRCQTLAIDGLGGVGKTQLALQFAYWVKDNHPKCSVLWVPVLTCESFSKAYYEIGKKIGIVKKSLDKEDPRGPVRDFLNSEESGKWLLILDNADHEKIVMNISGGIRAYLPHSDMGLTVLTTRNRLVGTALARNNLIAMSCLSQNDAENFLRASLLKDWPLRDRRSTMKLLRKLEYLPLAIAQAAAYINNTNVPIKTYLSLLEQEQASLMQQDLPDTTRELDPFAAELLNFISCIEPKAIPFSLLPLEDSKEGKYRALGTLRSYAFLTSRETHATEDFPVQGGDKMEIDCIQDEEVQDVQMEDEDNPEVLYDMHGLVHAAARQWMELKNKTDDVLINALGQVEAAWEASGGGLWRDYLPHTRRLLSHSEPYDDVEEKHDLYFRLGQCLSVDHRFHEAIICYEQVYAKRNVTGGHGNHNPDRSLDFGLGKAYLAVGRTREAVSLLERVAEVQRWHRSERDPKRLLCEGVLASAYIDGGQAAEAIGILEYIIEIQSGILAPDNPGLLQSTLLLGRAYIEARYDEGALRVLEDTVSIYDGVNYEKHDDYDEYGTNHLMAQHFLGLAYVRAGLTDDAVKILKHVVSKHAEVHEEDDAYRLSSEELLAEIYREMDGYEALGNQLMEHVWSVKNRLSNRYSVQGR
ncbi:HET-domain-containing protein [Apiospora saccharicola]